MRILPTASLMIVVLLIAGCSKLEHKPPAESLRQASDYIETARKWEAKQDWRMAAELYTLAWNQYTLGNRESQKFLVAVAIARQYRRLNDEAQYRSWVANARSLLNPKYPERLAELSLLQIEEDMAQGRFDSVMVHTENPAKGDDAALAELLGYRVQAGAQLGRDMNPDIQRLNGICHLLDRKLKKGKLDDPSGLSFAEYSVGYAQLRANQPSRALSSLRKAYRIDQNYERPANLADDLYLIAHCQHQLHQDTDARASMSAARQIYQLLKATSQAQETERYLSEWP